jgi:hypothetical protein
MGHRSAIEQDRRVAFSGRAGFRSMAMQREQRRQGLERLRQVPAQVQSQFWVNFVDANMKLHSSQD